MCEFLAQQTERRNQRAQLIAERLEKAQNLGRWKAHNDWHRAAQ